jgi:hypothetical protein
VDFDVPNGLLRDYYKEIQIHGNFTSFSFIKIFFIGSSKLLPSPPRIGFDCV